jgi:hypothetical protein
MDRQSIDPQLNPKPDSLELHPIAVGCPLDLPKHRPELSRDFVGGYFETASGLFLRLVVLDGQGDQRHRCHDLTQRGSRERDVLREADGPMLQHGHQGFQGVRIAVPHDDAFTFRMPCGVPGR